MTDTPGDIDWALAARYLGGDCSPDERARVEHRIAGDPAFAEQLDALREIRDVWAARRRPVDMDAAWSALSRRVSLDVADRPRSRVGGRARQRGGSRAAPTTTTGWRSALIAASVVVLVGAAVIGGVRRRAVGGPTSAPRREFATAAAERLNVTLIDGTHFTLGPASRVRISADYGRAAGPRQVELEGEAFFDVAHDATRPFAVRTRNAVATDVGTRFDVRAFAGDAVTRIAVVEGSVAVTGAATGAARERALHEPSLLRVGDVAVVDTTVVVTHGADVAAMTTWTQGGLVFEGTPLRAAIQDLDRTFDLDITVADSALLSQPITASIGQEPVDDVLTAVAFAIGARYERVGRRVVIRRATSAGWIVPAPTAPEQRTVVMHARSR